VLKINKSKGHGYPKDERAWARMFSDMISIALNEREGIETQWARNAAYYFGFQHLLYDPMTKFIQVDGGRNDEYIINRIAGFLEQRVAKLAKSKPTLTVIPDKNDPLVIKGADISEKLLKNLWKINEKDEALEEAIMLSCLMGSSFKKTLWDSEAGDGVRDEQDEDGNIEFMEDGRQKTNVFYMGEVTSALRNAFQVLVPSGVKKIRKSEWICDRTMNNVDEIKKKFPDFDIDAALKHPDDTTRFEKFVYCLGLGSPYQFGATSFSGMERTGSKTSCRDLELAMVNEIWMAPNRIYENGILATMVGTQLLQLDEWPYGHRYYPFTKLDEHWNPFGFYGISTVTRLIPIQRHYNDSRTQVAKNRRLMAVGKWWAPLGCGLSEDSLTDEEGEVVQSNGNMSPPQQLGVAPLPNYVMQDMDRDIIDIRDVSGERSVDAQPFSGLTAGVAIETMAELSDIGLGPSIKNIERACISEAKLELLLANEYYTDERVMNVIGENKGDFSTVVFNNLDLKWQTDVTIQMEAGFGQSKSGIRQTLINFWDRRIIFDPEIFLKAWATGNLDILLRQKDPAEAIVIEDIEAAKQGAMPQVNPFDNHVVHIRMLSAFIQTPEFRKLPPDRQMIISQLLQMHLQYMQPQEEAPEQNQAAVGTPFGEQVTEGQ
jgi:hypothetical protein